MDAPIFVVGTPRSGTTLTARILGNHSRIFMSGETHFFDDIFARRKKLGDPRDPAARERIIARLVTLYGRYNEALDQDRIEKLISDPSFMSSLRNACTTYQDVLSFFMSKQMSYEGKVRWGNNVPKDIFSIEDIISFYPDVKVLVCLRDIRDFLLSYQHKWKITSPDNTDRLMKIYHPILTTLLWKSTVRRIKFLRSSISTRNFMVLRYESLVKNPEKVIRNICEFLHEEFEETTLEIDTHNSSFQAERHGIFSSSVGRWREKLTREEVYIAQKLARRELRELGYTLERVSVSPSRVARIVATFPYALWRALNANKVNRGPVIPYLMRRVFPFIMRGVSSPQ